MAATPTKTGPPRIDRPRPRLRGWHDRRLMAMGGLLAVLVAGATLGLVRLFGSMPATGTGGSVYPTALEAVEEGSLSSTTSVDGTLGYAGSDTVLAPSGTTQQQLSQAQQAVAGAEAALAADEKASGDAAVSTGESTQASVTQAEEEAASTHAALSGDQTAASDAAASSNQAIAQDQAAVTTAQTQLSDDQSILSAGEASLASDQAKEAKDCAGSGSSSPACQGDQQAVSSDQQTVSSDEQRVTDDQAALTQAANQLADGQLSAQQSQDQWNAKLAADQAAVQDAETALSEAQGAARTDLQQDADEQNAKLTQDELALQDAVAALAQVQADAVNPGTTYTSLPSVGLKVKQGQALYSVNGIPVTLLYGGVTPWRDFQPGMSDGTDVGELNADLQALGFGTGLSPSNHFSAATDAAAKRWQASIGAPQTGIIAIGEVVFEPGEIVVTAVSPTVGGSVQPGQTILTASSTSPQVSVALDASLQSDVMPGDAVTITLPDNQTTQGTVVSVATVATTPSSSGSGSGSSSTPTVTVLINLRNPGNGGGLDQVPVEVAITTGTVRNALIVPVDALLATSRGGYEVEVVGAQGVHHFVEVTPGLFDDASGAVEVTAPGLSVGQRVVVPNI
jgi:hypothetical protein